MYLSTVQASFGTLFILADHEAVCAVTTKKPDTNAGENELSRQAARELGEYLAGKRTVFDVPVMPKGTDFQRAVWRALLKIPYGQTRSYQQIAHALGKPAAVRAVANAIGKNPVWILIPCHRVIGKGGALTGYAGGLPMKKALLELEAASESRRLQHCLIHPTDLHSFGFLNSFLI